MCKAKSSACQEALRPHAVKLVLFFLPCSDGSNACRFYSKLDVVLNEDVLIGKSRACQEALRAPAASTLAELIVHVRSELTLQQIQRIVYLFSR